MQFLKLFSGLVPFSAAPPFSSTLLNPNQTFISIIGNTSCHWEHLCLLQYFLPKRSLQWKWLREVKQLSFFFCPHEFESWASGAVMTYCGESVFAELWGERRHTGTAGSGGLIEFLLSTLSAVLSFFLNSPLRFYPPLLLLLFSSACSAAAGFSEGPSFTQEVWKKGAHVGQTQHKVEDCMWFFFLFSLMTYCWQSCWLETYLCKKRLKPTFFPFSRAVGQAGC